MQRTIGEFKLVEEEEAVNQRQLVQNRSAWLHYTHAQVYGTEVYLCAS